MANPEKNEQRNTFARECMFLALKRLLKQKPFEEITVSELIKVAGVSRTTFYRNYHSLAGILEDYLERYPFGAVSVESYSPEKFDLRGRLHDSFASLKEEQQLINSMLKSELDRLIYNNYDKLIKGTCRQRAFEIGFRSDYELSAFVGMYYGICYDWIRGGMKEEIDSMVDTAYRIIHTFYKNDEYAVPEQDNVYLPIPPKKNN